MVCPKCNVRMLCFDTANDTKKMQTARKYKCGKCGEIIYTLEHLADRGTVLEVLVGKWVKKHD